MCSHWLGLSYEHALPSMGANMSESLELRVLSGLHAQARCPIQNDDVLGADPACDVVLADAGLGARAARLRVGAKGWDLTLDDADMPAPTGEPATPFNQPLPLGPVWVTVARRTGPWTDLPQAANDSLASPDDAPALVVERADESGAEAVDTGEDDNNPRQPPGRSRSENWLMTLGLATVGLAVVVAVLMVWLLPGTQPAVINRPDPRAAAERSLGQINAAIERLGLASRLRVNLTPEGATYVSGWVRNTAERDALAGALAQVWPMPAMRVSSEEAAIQTADSVLKGYPVKYAPRYDGAGRLTVLGIAGSAEDRAAALDALRGQLPGMTVIGNDILLAPAVADALSSELTDAGLGGIALTWRDNMLQAGAGGLDDIQMAELETVLAQFNNRHFGVAKLATAGRQFADTVPFRIRSVVGGPVPFIVLEDGSKLLVGGTYKRYRLTAIEDKRLLFDGPRSAIVLR